MTSRMTTCLALALLPAVAAAQSPDWAQRVPAASERLSLDGAVRIAIENNRRLQAARLQIEKADQELAAVRTRRLPAFETTVSSSQLLTPVEFSFPQGAFRNYPGSWAKALASWPSSVSPA